MKKLFALFALIMVVVIVNPVVAQDKSDTKSVLTDNYKQLLTNAIAALQLGNVDVTQYASTQIDSILRVCFLTDAENVFNSVTQNIADGKIQRPKLIFDKVDGKPLFKRSTIRAYKKGFQKFIKTLPMSVKASDYDTFVKKNKMLVAKPKAKLLKEFKNHLNGKLLNVK